MTWSRRGRPAAVRFWEKVDKRGEDCWPWKGCRNEYGYGRFGLGPSLGVGYAHRVAWELTHGPIPDDKECLHRCDGGSDGCVNPDHLYLGTQVDNMRDMVERGRSAKRAHHSQAKLSEDNVRWIRRQLNDGMRQRDIAASLGIDQSTVSNIVTGRLWKEA